MRRTGTLLLIAAALSLSSATDDNTWSQWTSSSPAPAPTPAAQGWTDWITTTEYKEKTIHDTETKLVTTTVYVTETATQVTTATVTVVKTTTFIQAAPPPETRTTTSFVTVTHTEVQVSVSGTVSTLAAPPPETRTATLVSLETITGLITNVITSVRVATQTVSVSYCPPTITTPLVGLVPCTSRIINPEYTPTTKLPDNYLWGCPPGSLCKPKQEGCNFESNPPADSYICAPDQCEPVEDIPSPDSALGLEDVNSTCAWYTPIDDYFNLNPKLFGLEFAIFNTLGQAKCTTPPPPPPPPPPPTTTSTFSWVPWTTSFVPPPVVTTTPSPLPPPSTTPSSSWHEWTTSAARPPAPVSSSWGQWSTVSSGSASSAWGGWSHGISSAAPTPVSSAVWNNWQPGASWGPSSQSYPAHVTKRAELERRQGIVVPSACYAVCNHANLICQNVGTDPSLCQTSGEFSQAVRNIRACTSKYQANQDVLSAVTLVNNGLNYCSSLSANAAASSTSVPQQSIVQSTSTATTPPPSSSSAPQVTATQITSTSMIPSSPSQSPASSGTSAPSVTSGTSTASSSAAIASYTPTPGSAATSIMPPVTDAFFAFILSVVALMLRV